MNKRGKAVIVLLILLAAASISLSGVIYFNLEKEKNQSAALSQKISEIESGKSELAAKLQEQKVELSKAYAKLEQNEKRIKELRFSLDEEKNKAQEAVSELASLRGDLAEAKTSKADLERKVSKNEEEIGSFKEQIAKLKKLRTTLEAKLKELNGKSDIELGKIIIAPEGGKKEPLAKDLEGKILVVNKEYGFAVINLGAQDGVSAGDMLSIYKNDKYIGDIVIERVDKIMSSANFLSSSIKDKVQEGYRVVRKAS
jgi:myosin heavy subunit